MAICKLVIASAVDGQASKLVRMGRIEKADNITRLSYREENAEVCITLEGARANIRRKGDYFLSLPLVQGEKTEGTLGLGGAEGGVFVWTHQVRYSYTQDALVLTLEYDLLFGEQEKQKMQLHIQATTRGKI